MTIANCLFYENVATVAGTSDDTSGRGGALHVTQSSLPVSLINCTVTENFADRYGGLVYAAITAPGAFEHPVENGILWGNTDDYDDPDQETEKQTEQIFDPSDPMDPEGVKTASISFTCIEGLVPGGLWDNGTNIGDDPMFEEVAENNFRLKDSSPCRGTGANALIEAVPDSFDVNENGDLTEPTPDRDRCVRVLEPVVDMGGFEFNPCPEDVDGDGSVGFNDLTNLLGQWDECSAPCCPVDLTHSGSVGYDDLTQLLGNWGPCEESAAAMGGGGGGSSLAAASGTSLESAAAMAALMDAVAQGHLTPQQCEAVISAILGQ